MKPGVIIFGVAAAVAVGAMLWPEPERPPAARAPTPAELRAQYIAENEEQIRKYGPHLIAAIRDGRPEIGMTISDAKAALGHLSRLRWGDGVGGSWEIWRASYPDATLILSFESGQLRSWTYQ